MQPNISKISFQHVINIKNLVLKRYLLLINPSIFGVYFILTAHPFWITHTFFFFLAAPAARGISGARDRTRATAAT